MPNRTLVWTLAALAVVLVVVPLLGMFGMMSMQWMGGGMMMGMGVVGTLWGLLRHRGDRGACGVAAARNEQELKPTSEPIWPAGRFPPRPVGCVESTTLR